MKSKTSGFTLIEVVVVMAIIAVLASLVVGAIRIARNTAAETTHRSNAKTLQTALEAYYARNRKYPNNGAGTSLATVAGQLGVHNLGPTNCKITGVDLGGGAVCASSTGECQNWNDPSDTKKYSYII